MRETEGEASALAPDTTPSLDLVFDLLSNSRRRYALYYLNERPDGVATVESLTDNVVALERLIDDESESEPTTVADHDDDGESSDSRSAVQLELQHVHLPKLEDAGILEHDRRSETVRYWSQPSLEEWLEHAHHKEIA